MKFVLDENFPRSAVEVLSNMGHEAVNIRNEGLRGKSDEELFLFCQDLKGIFLTTDRDFFHTIPHSYPEHFGVIVIALRQPNRERILTKLDWLLKTVSSEDIESRVFQLRDNAWSVYPSLDS